MLNNLKNLQMSFFQRRYWKKNYQIHLSYWQPWFEFSAERSAAVDATLSNLQRL